MNEILASGFQVVILCQTPKWGSPLKAENQSNIKELVTITQKELKKISSQKTPSQVIAVVKKPEYKIVETDLLNNLSLVLDRINDPGNLGTIIRIADWFGIENIICSPDTVDVYNQKVIQSTMGSICRIKLHYQDLIKLLSKFKDEKEFGIYGASLNGENIYHTSLLNKGFILMGNESHGISKELLPYITKRLYIPNFSSNVANKPESLNVSVATGIFCAEFRRRKNKA